MHRRLPDRVVASAESSDLPNGSDALRGLACSLIVVSTRRAAPDWLRALRGRRRSERLQAGMALAVVYPEGPRTRSRNDFPKLRNFIRSPIGNTAPDVEKYVRQFKIRVHVAVTREWFPYFPGSYRLSPGRRVFFGSRNCSVKLSLIDLSSWDSRFRRLRLKTSEAKGRRRSVHGFARLWYLGVADRTGSYD